MKNKITRRYFIKHTCGLTLGLATSQLFANKEGIMGYTNDIKAAIPLPIQIVIDDVGWWSGKNGSANQEPYRTGINRNHVPADYQAIVDLGKALNIRPQAAMVLCEWDRENILRNLPNSTWMGDKWDNKKWVGPWLEEAADIILNNKEYFEFTLHGIGHEYWTDGKFTRAEWADKKGTMRPVDRVEKHLEYFEKLMIQNNLGSFPTSYVPTAFLHNFGISQGHNISIAEILKKRNVDYINTPFEDMFGREKVSHKYFGIDNGVITIDRGRDVLSWNSIGKKPKGKLISPTCGLHWPNLLHSNPDQNNEIVDSWVKFLKPYNENLNTLLASDSLSFRSQLVNHICTKINFKNPNVEIDFHDTDKLMYKPDYNHVIIKIESQDKLKFKAERIKILESNLKGSDNSYLYTLTLERIPEHPIANININKM